VTRASYTRAERFLPWHAARLMRGLTIDPRWIDDGDTFWFRQTTPAGARFVRCDPAVGTCEPVFDHVRLAAALSRATSRPFAADCLPITEIEPGADSTQVRISLEGTWWTVDLETYACTQGEAAAEPAPDVARSPDGAREIFARDDNLWLREVESGAERALTTDGEDGYAYGSPLPSPLVAAGLADAAKPLVVWSADGTRFLTCRIDRRQANDLYLVQSVPKDGSLRPKLHTYAYPLPGDEAVPAEEIWLVDLESGTAVKTGVDPLPVLYHGQPVSPDWVWWTADGAAVFRSPVIAASAPIACGGSMPARVRPGW
jgi:hypothetical protein